MKELNKNIVLKILIKFRNFRFRKYRRLWVNKKVTILSNFCISGLIYKTLGMEFCSPTVNISSDGKDMIKFSTHLNDYINCNLVEYKQNNKLVQGVLKNDKYGDIIISFPHSKSFKEAKEQWGRRKIRINKNNILIIIKEKFPDKVFCEEFKKINCNHKLVIHLCKNIIEKDFYYCKHLDYSKYGFAAELKYCSIFGKRNFDFLPYINMIQEIVEQDEKGV